jgi:hypothetical protein
MFYLVFLVRFSDQPDRLSFGHSPTASKWIHYFRAVIRHDLGHHAGLGNRRNPPELANSWIQLRASLAYRRRGELWIG